MRLALRYYRPDSRVEMVWSVTAGRHVPTIALTPEEEMFARLMGTRPCGCGCEALIVERETERALFE